MIATYEYFNKLNQWVHMYVCSHELKKYNNDLNTYFIYKHLINNDKIRNIKVMR